MPSENMGYTINLLVVEDDEVDVEALHRMLKKSHVNVPLHRARDGVEALEMLRGEKSANSLARPLVVLLDINMPKMNGIEMLKELRSDPNLRDSIVFVLTTSPRDRDRQAAFNLNVAGYFLKDNIEDLVQLISLYCKINMFPE